MPSALDTTLTEKDMSHLQLTDDQFKPFSWADICDVIETGHVERFRRWPSDLAKYFAHKEQILQRYPSLEKYILAEKLRWSDPPIVHSSVPYSDPRDLQIRYNDHPYAFVPGITHLVVWSACRFPERMDKLERHKVYEEFVEKHFSAIPKEQRVWFVNWGALQSVPGLEHFHVLLRDVEQERIDMLVSR